MGRPAWYACVDGMTVCMCRAPARVTRVHVPRAPRTFDALEVGRQQKAVAIGDVLQVEEIERLQLRRGRCFAYFPTSMDSSVS